MAFAWLRVPLETTFGPVVGLHWDYYDGKEDGGAAAGEPTEDGEGAPAGKERGAGVPLEGTDDLCDAEDELGAVMWNANGVSCDAIAARLSSAGASSTPSALTGWDVLELGAGVGVMGVALALGGANVLVTDLPRLEALMRRTLRENTGTLSRRAATAGRVAAAGFDWMAKTLPPAVAGFAAGKASDGGAKGRRLCVCMCDALYGNPKTWGPLIKHLAAIHDAAVAARGTAPLFLNFCEQRVANHEDAFFEQLRAADARWEAATTTLPRKSELGLPVRMTEFSMNAGSGSANGTAVVASSESDNTQPTLPAKASKKDKRARAGASPGAERQRKPPQPNK